MVRIPDTCPYCGSKELAIGLQQGNGSMLKTKSGLTGCRIQHLLCTKCGSILHSSVEKPEKFRTK